MNRFSIIFFTALIFLLGFGQTVSAQFFSLLRDTTEKAEKGDAECQYILGTVYYLAPPAWGVPKNMNMAKKWITKAAEQGYQDAIAFLKEQSFEDSYEAQRDSINYTLEPSGIFLSYGKESVILNFPGVSEKDLYRKFAKACRDYKDEIEKYSSSLSKFKIDEVGGSEIVFTMDLNSYKNQKAHERFEKDGYGLSGGYYNLIFQVKFSFKPGRARILVVNDECKFYEYSSFTESSIRYFPNDFFKDGEFKSKKDEIAVNRLNKMINLFLRCIVGMTESTKLEDDW